MHLTTGGIWLWIICLLVLEVCHLKWLWWENWNCRSCGVRNHACHCGRAHRIMKLF